MDSELNIIGDVAGQYKALLKLVEKMPRCPVLLVGDLIDRGPDSRKVVEYVREGRAMSLKGNHEDMCVDFVTGGKKYDRYSWFENGAGPTLRSFMPNLLSTDQVRYGEIQEALGDTARWMQSLPIFHWDKGCGLFVSHAPVRSEHQLESSREMDLLWNRSAPRKPWDTPNTFLVHGHNSRKNVLWYQCDGHPIFGANIDTSAGQTLTGLHWPTRQIYTQSYG